ncbi:extensin-like protein [Ruegeria marisrubri]|uniref:Extensin-like protein n=1 Tax=Ruegeria marisrubri TaxID=1685379 RepID=A0A0X3TCA0_9RHOB|nr:extensin-like protein [Ruegeria marisrubri]
MMRRGGIALLGAMALVATTSAANPPGTSLPPKTRPDAGDNLVAAASARVEDTAATLAGATLRPEIRPVSRQVLQAAVRPADLPGLGPDVSLFPFLRPEEVEQKAFFKKRRLRKGSVCGNIEIQGKSAGKVPGRIKGCGIEDAVEVTSISGVRLSRPSLMDCGTAEALNQWVERSVKPTFRRRGPVVELKVAAHYACRTRNNQKGARISEHGKGRAIDISAFVMMDGEVLTVLEGWKRDPSRKLLRKVRKGACGPFGTVLGPGSDGYHRDHFHVDTARHRGGPVCR